MMTENQCIIDLDTKINIADTSIELDEKWVSQVTNELNNLTETSSMESVRWRKHSVYRVPSSVKDLCKTAYEPQTVSIGPYHHEKPHLKAMEEHKHRALLHFLKRSGKPLHCYVNALAPVVEDLKDSYDQLDDKWKSTGAFLELMIVDGCFILELLRTTTATDKSNSKEHTTMGHADNNPVGKQISNTDELDTKEHMMMGYADNDPVFSNHGRLYTAPYLRRDMLMLENQLPMLVLTTLAAESNMPTKSKLSKQGEVTKLILKFFSRLPRNNRDIEQLGKCLHISDVYRKSLLWNPVTQKKKSTERSSWLGCHKLTLRSIWPRGEKGDGDDIIRYATELREAGINIKKSKTTSLEDREDEVTRLILKFFHGTRENRNLGKCLHILDVYRKSLLLLNPFKPEKEETSTQKCINKITQKCFRGEKEGKDEIIRSATELQDSGITIKKSKTRYLEDISFNCRGVLELPAIVVDDTFESGYLNLMAFERFHVGAGNEVTSYVFFMDNIIDSARDVSLLHSCGIIQNALGSDKAVATLFNSLSKDITLDPNSSLDVVHKQVSEYCRKLLPWCKATLKHNYFTNPWVGLSVVAAIFLFALTGLQTVYSVLGYYDPT